jgi:ribonuclease Z
VRITFLGTSAGTPTRERNVTAQALQFANGGWWLLDCGEATQHQVMRAGLRAGRCERILITHLHGDHCYGLPGMLSCIGIQGRSETLEVAGPPGLREFLETILRLSEAHLPYPLVITELPATGGTLAPLGGWTVSAHPLVHRVTCLGYVLREAPTPGRFHLDRARRIGIPEGPLFAQLQRGEPVRLDDGRIVVSSDVMDPPRRGRIVVLLGDTSDPSGIAEAATGCDVLVCETTYEAAREAKAVEWGHSTSAMTGAFAQRIGARTLLITHFSSRYGAAGVSTGAPTIAELVAETRAACPATQVLAADDLWTFTVDRP